MAHAFAGALAVVIASLLWSLDGFLRQSLYSLPPAVVVFWEHVLGFIVLLPAVVITWRNFRRVSRRQWAAIAAVAFLSGALGTVLYTAALGAVGYIDFSVVVVLQQLQPVFAISAAGLWLREKLTGRFLALAASALLAAYFVSFPKLSVTAAPGAGTAALLALGAAASWGVSTALSKYALRDTSWLSITAARFGFTPVFSLAMVLLLGQAGLLTSLTPPQWWTIAGITFSTGLVALAIYYFGLKRIPASRSTILELAWPLSAAVVGFVFLGDRLTMTQWAGAAVLVATMYLVERDVARHG